MVRVAQFNHSETPPPSIWGEPGDQLKVKGEYETAKVFERGELNIVPWYDGQWLYAFRPVYRAAAWHLADLAETTCRNPLVGYSQTNDRESFYRELKSANWRPDRIKKACNGDCSAGFSALSTAAGMDMPKDLYTGNMVQYIMNSDHYLKMRAASFLSSPDYLLEGDVLLRPATDDRGGHTLTVIDSGDEVFDYLLACINAGTWNLRRSPNYYSEVMDVLEGGRHIDIYLPCIWADGISWYFAETGGIRGFISRAAFTPRYEVEVLADTWLRSSPNISGERISVVPAGDSLIISTGQTQQDGRGVTWYQVAYGNRWGWVSSKNAALIYNIKERG